MEHISSPERLPASNSTTVTSKVRVILRVRPFLLQEVSFRNGNPVSCVASVLHPDHETSDEVIVHLKDNESRVGGAIFPYKISDITRYGVFYLWPSRNERYKLDGFFGQEDNNVIHIFHKEVSHLIPGIFLGQNATVFAYGATGSGKTYTMQGSAETPGLIPLAMESILSICQSTGSTVAISYYEIYMDKCYDLLELKNKEVAILDDKDGKVHLKGLAEVEVSSMTGFYEVFYVAIQRRKVAHTNVNDLSSRSHCVLVISVSTPGHENSGDLITGKLNLIDLAGNEYNRKTCNEGIRLQESAKINQSLFALSNVIHALNNSQLRIPYRESKLTRVLQDSLGGTSRALMVSCLNPGEYQESVHTVSLAARSRHISNSLTSARKETPNVKVDMEAKLHAWLESRGKTKSAQKPKVFASPLTSTTPNSLIKRVDAHPSSSKAKLFSNQGASGLKQRTPDVAFRSLISSGHRFISATEALNVVDVRRNTEKKLEVSEDRDQEFDDCKSDDQVARDEKISNVESANPIGPSPPLMKSNAFQSPPRKALSPINTNINIESISAKKRNGSLTDLKNNVDSTLQVLGTPLGKFNAQSSNLKSFFAEEYIEFLNTASREELLEIRGIGDKLAEYILEVREGSPLKTLNDLEKLGLSSKQVKNLFGKAAKALLFE